MDGGKGFLLISLLLLTSTLLVFLGPISLLLTLPILLGALYGGEKNKNEDLSTELLIPRCQECGRELETPQEIESGYCFNCSIEDPAIASIA